MLTLEPYDASQAQAWDDFVEREARNATILHTRRFFSHNPANAVDDASVSFRKGGRIVGVLPATLREAPGGPVLNSHPRSTYGGFVVAPSVGAAEAVEMVDLTLEFARQRGAREVVVRNPFRIYHALPSDETDYAMWLRGFGVRSRELELAVPLLPRAREEVLATFEPSTRRNVRRALQSGVSVGESEDFAAYWAILEENLREQHGAVPTHTLEEFRALRAALGGDRVRLVAAHHEGRMVAGVIVLCANRLVAHSQYIASLREASSVRPLNAVFYELVAWATASGFRYLNLGKATDDDGRALNVGLFNFKEGFGARSVLRETMAATL
jgi:hypothetical protein